MTVSIGLFGLACQIFLSIIFGAAACHKLRDPKAFVEVLRGYRVLPEALLGLTGAVVIGLEGFVGIGLWLFNLSTQAAVTAALLLAAYALVIGVNLARGRREIDCGCSWGKSAQPLAWTLVIRNAILLVPCSFLFWVRGVFEIYADPVELSGIPGALAALAAAVVMLICYWSFEGLIANQPALARLREGRAN